MRKVQISIKMELFADQANNGESEKFLVYADAQNVWEAVCAGFDSLMTVLKEHGRKLPTFGVKESWIEKGKRL